MPLIDVLLSSTLGKGKPPERFDIALYSGSNELTDAGYARAEVHRGEWVLRKGSAEAVGRFGPFVDPVAFDRAVLYRGKEIVEESTMRGPMQIAPGGVYEHTFGAVFERTNDP